MAEVVRMLQKTQPEKAKAFMAGTGAGVILSHVNCTYIRPVFYPDTLLTGLKVSLVGTDRFVLSHTIYSTAQKHIVAVGVSEFVSFDYVEMKRIPLPEHILEAMECLEADRGNPPLKKSDNIGDFPSKRARL